MARTKSMGYEAVRLRERRRTPAQKYSRRAGLVLLVVGVGGFFVDSSFDTGGSIEGDSFLGIEVNGFSNVLHLFSGLVLLAVRRRSTGAKAVALFVGIVYGVVAVIGFADGDTVIGLFPVNTVANVFHAVIGAILVLAAVASEGAKHAVPAPSDTPPTTGRRIESTLAPTR